MIRNGQPPMACGVVGFHVPLPGYELHAGDFQLIAANGLGWVEMDYAWRLIEPQPGILDFAYYDELTQAARACGLHILAKLGNGYNGSRATVPDWTVGLAPGDYLQALEGYGRAVVSRYAGSIAAWALENEANVAAMHTQLGWRVGAWPQDRVLAIWNTLGHLVRQLAPGAPILLSLADLGPMASTMGLPGIETWLAAVADSDLPYDQVGLQTYLCRFSKEQDCYQATTNQIRRLADLSGKPVTILETGLSTTDPHHDEQTQAAFMQRIVPAARKGGAWGLFIYEYLDNPLEPDHPERGFGLVRPDRTPKPAWQAYAEAIAALARP